MQSQINVVSSVFIDSLHRENIPLLLLSCFDSESKIFIFIYLFMGFY